VVDQQGIGREKSAAITHAQKKIDQAEGQRFFGLDVLQAQGRLQVPPGMTKKFPQKSSLRSSGARALEVKPLQKNRFIPYGFNSLRGGWGGLETITFHIILLH